MPHNIKSILETAISEEMKASRFYSNLALQMEQKGTRLKFDDMAAVEMTHYELLFSYYEKKYKQIPVVQETRELKIVRPETPSKTASFADAIKVIMDTEWRAYEFYKRAVGSSADAKEQEMFTILAKVELSHYEHFRTEYNYTTEATIRFASEDIPWMMEVS
ncbi:MAG: ferritin family protein [Candidatus Brocadia sp.]|nr:MAG: ferritin family protein [Candidatus Brocadia sp.]